MKKRVLSFLTIIGIVVFTGCANLGLGGDTLSGLDQTVEQAYQQYQAGVAAGQFPSDARIADYYLKYKFLYGAFSGVLKPSAAPPTSLLAAKADLEKSITEAKAKAKVTPTPAP